MQKIEELIAALEKAEGPDRDLDADILEAIGECAHRETEYYCIEDGNDVDSGFTCKRCHKDTYGERVAAFTASIDAAVALVERVLPDAFWVMSRGRLRIEEPLYAAQILFGLDEILGEAEGNSLPIAICLATLRAKLSQEKN
ncbi:MULTISPECIES: hypothetical protein [unclassified Rhizobium]|uniref:hypothetical protein n=1 Tax=unclassified Rhizobium TaxID=2613769 RepID=UPI0038297264